MRILLKSDARKVYVAYGIYWSDVKGRLERYHNVIEPGDGLAGFDVLPESAVDIIDPSLDNYTLLRNDMGKDLLLHNAVYLTDGLFDALVSHDDPKNVERLFQNMRDMGLDP